MRRATLATLILLTASRALGADFEELLRRAAETRDAGDQEETLKLLRAAYQIRPVPEVLNNIGRTLEDLGRYDEAAAAYRRVVEDPSAKPALVELDRQRLDALAPKLGRSWLQIEAEESRAFLDGDPAQIGVEIEVPIGPHLLELSRHPNAVLIFFTALPSRRIEVVRDPTHRQESEALLDLSEAPISRLFLNDRPIGSDIHRLLIALPPGTYRIRAETPDGVQSKQIRIGEGRTLLLRSVLDRPRPLVTDAVREPPSRPMVGPIVLAASGLVAAGVGAYLAAVAEQDRNRVRDAEREGELITGISMIEAVRLESRANDRGTAAIVAFSAAGALVIGALFWWVFP